MENMMDQIKKDVAVQLEGITEISETKVLNAIENCVFQREKEMGSNIFDKEHIIKKTYDSMLGFGPVQPLMEDDEITEIMINADKVYFEKSGRIYKSEIRIENPEESMKIIRSICRKSGRTVNMTSPITDACLDDGTRINIVLSPVSVKGHAITIRKFPQNPITHKDMISSGFSTAQAMEFLENVFKARYNLFICGGAGTGKTTLLNVLGNFAGQNERIITIEDSAELKIDKIENIVCLETRIKNVEGKGEISIRELIKTSLRMRPDRIIVGEVRGEEAIDMLQAMNTGHEGSISTGHANSCRELISRLETMVLMGKDMPLKAVRKQITMAIDIIICVSKVKEKRRIVEICELSQTDSGEEVLIELFGYDYSQQILKKTGELQNKFKLKRFLK